MTADKLVWTLTPLTLNTESGVTQAQTLQTMLTVIHRSFTARVNTARQLRQLNLHRAPQWRDYSETPVQPRWQGDSSADWSEALYILNLKPWSPLIYCVY